MRHLLLTLLSLSALVTPSQAEGVSIRHVRVGFPDGEADRYKVGAWAPVTVDLHMPNSGSFEGNVVVETADGDGVWTRYTTPANRTRGGTITSYIKVGARSANIRVVLQGTWRDAASSANAPTELNQAVTYEPSHRTSGLGPEAKLILAIGQPRGLDVSERESGTNAERGWEVAFQRDPSQLPDHWFGYDAVDAVVLPTGDLALVQALVQDEKRRTALEQWVRMGGHLVLSVSRNHKLIGDRNRFPLEPMLPAQIDTASTAPISRVRSVEYLVESKIEGLEKAPFAFVTTGDRPGGQEPPAVQVARLTPRRSGGSRAFEQTLTRPVIVHGPHGLGKVTLLAFDTEDEPFRSWRNFRHFWTVLLDLRPKAAQVRRAYTFALDPTEQDLAARLAKEMETIAEVPAIHFGWIALLIFGYILVIGPLDYLLLRKVVKRLEWTWLTFPVIVVLVCVAAYYLTVHIKGNQLRVNKLDAIDIDFSTQRVYGNTWLTLFSPRLQQYDVGVEPARLGNRAEALTVSWMGRPEGGMRGLEGAQSPTLFRRYYHYEANAQAIRGVPISVWSVKTLTARWETVLDGQNPVLLNRLRWRPPAVVGSLELARDFPWTLHRCRLLYGDQGWELGTLTPGKEVEMSQYTAISLANLVAGTTARVETSRSSRLNDLLGELMFHGAIATRQRSKSGYLDYLDQSWRLEFPEAILMGEVAETEGAAAELNESASAPSRLMPFRPELSGRLRQNTTVRFFLPVPKEQS